MLATFNPRQLVIDAAISQLHETEPRAFWLDAFGSLPPKYERLAWCGVFALWCLRQAKLTSRRWIQGRGFIWVDEHGKGARLPYLPVVHPSRIGIGDIAYFDKPHQHYALVECLDQPNDGRDLTWVKLIAGNTPDVDQSWVRRSKAQFYSIARLVETANQLQLPKVTNG